MKKLIKSFLTKSFIIFCIIGVLNTLIDLGVYNLYIFSKLADYKEIVATTLAFIVASIFSYFANAKFTYQQKSSRKTFWQSMIVFVAKLGLQILLTIIFNAIFRACFNSKTAETLVKLTPIPRTCIILPLQFIAFNFIFKKAKTEEENIENK